MNPTLPLLTSPQLNCVAFDFNVSNIAQVVADGVAGADLLDQFERGEILLDGDGK